MIAIVGPTASGKSKLAFAVAKKCAGEIINCDSVQIYQGFDIGSGKPSIEEQAEIPHHLYDIVSAEQSFDAGAYAIAARKIMDELAVKKGMGIIVGGTGLYLRALMGEGFHQDLPSSPELRQRLSLWEDERVTKLLKRLDPVRESQLHLHDRYRRERALELRVLRRRPFSDLAESFSSSPRPSFDLSIIKISPPREWLREKIAQRVEQMFVEGWVDEVKKLRANGVSASSKPMQSIGYREVNEWLDGKISTLEELKNAVIIATRQYAKRQQTWFRKVPASIELSGTHFDEDLSRVMEFIAGKKIHSRNL